MANEAIGFNGESKLCFIGRNETKIRTTINSNLFDEGDDSLSMITLVILYGNRFSKGGSFEAMSQKSLFREDWFQNGSFVSLTLYIKDVDRDESNVTFTQQTVTVNLFSARDKSIYEQTWELSHPVVAEQSLVTYFPQKVELKMKKKEEGLLWKQLTSGATLKSSDNTQSSYSSRETASLQSGRFPKQFAVEEDDDEEQDQSKDLLAFFRDIYEKSDEDTRRAMVKSFVESQGKVLSTDWKKVSSQNSRYDNE